MQRVMILGLILGLTPFAMLGCGPNEATQGHQAAIPETNLAGRPTQITSSAAFNELVFPHNYGYESLSKVAAAQAAKAALEKSLQAVNATAAHLSDHIRFGLTLNAGNGCAQQPGGYHLCTLPFTLRTTVNAYLADAEIARQSQDLQFYDADITDSQERLTVFMRDFLNRLAAQQATAAF